MTDQEFIAQAEAAAQAADAAQAAQASVYYSDPTNKPL